MGAEGVSAVRDERMLRAALSYVGRGWSVFPCRPGDKRPAADLLPLVDGKPSWAPFQEAAPTEAQVRDWWTARPAANIAVVTGAVSGIVVLDIDRHPGGADGAETLRGAGLDVPPTRAVQTPSGGIHAYFRHPGGDLRNWQARADLPGVDARGDGGYVLAPPSRTEAGEYAAVAKTRDLPYADPPGWLVEGMRGRRRAEPPSPAPSDVWAALWTVTCTPGDRHPTLVRLAGHWREHGHGEAEALAMALAWNSARCAPPKPDDEIRATVQDLYRRYSDPTPDLEPVPWTVAEAAFGALPEDLRGRLRSQRRGQAAGALAEALRRGTPPAVALVWAVDLLGEEAGRRALTWATRAAREVG